MIRKCYGGQQIPPKNRNARKPKKYNGWEDEKEKYPMSAAEGQHRDYI